VRQITSPVDFAGAHVLSRACCADGARAERSLAVWIFSGDLLSEAMKAEDLSTTEVARRAELSYSMVDHVRSGRRQPSALAAARLAAAVDRHPSELCAQVDDDSGDRPTELGQAVDAWVELMLRIAPELSQEQADRISAALFQASA
jgi:transcriptional regulator with XRE-family HTH domain